MLYLKFFDVVQKCRGEYLFENQLIVLNSFLPAKEMNDNQLKMLYAQATESQEVQFFLQDIPQLEEIPFLKKLQEIGFKETFRDEPFIYHAQICDLLLKTTFDQHYKEAPDADDAKQDFLDATSKLMFNISMNKLKKVFKFTYLIALLNHDDDLTYYKPMSDK